MRFTQDDLEIHAFFTPVNCDCYGVAGMVVLHYVGEILLVFPTIKHLEQLSDFKAVADLLTYAAGREVLPIEPHVVVEGEVARILLPGEPGY